MRSRRSASCSSMAVCCALCLEALAMVWGREQTCLSRLRTARKKCFSGFIRGEAGLFRLYTSYSSGLIQER